METRRSAGPVNFRTAIVVDGGHLTKEKGFGLTANLPPRSVPER